MGPFYMYKKTKTSQTESQLSEHTTGTLLTVLWRWRPHCKTAKAGPNWVTLQVSSPKRSRGGAWTKSRCKFCRAGNGAEAGLDLVTCSRGGACAVQSRCSLVWRHGRPRWSPHGNTRAALETRSVQRDRPRLLLAERCNCQRGTTAGHWGSATFEFFGCLTQSVLQRPFRPRWHTRAALSVSDVEEFGHYTTMNLEN